MFFLKSGPIVENNLILSLPLFRLTFGCLLGGFDGIYCSFYAKRVNASKNCALHINTLYQQHVSLQVILG